MHGKSPVECHREVVDLRKQESSLKKLLSIPRRKLDQEELSKVSPHLTVRLIASSPRYTRSLNQLGEQAACIDLRGSYRCGWSSLEYGFGHASFGDSRLR